jgi:hypothetical protein
MLVSDDADKPAGRILLQVATRHPTIILPLLALNLLALA